MSSQRPITWREARELRQGDNVVFTRDFVVYPADPGQNADIPDITACAGSTAVVALNQLDAAGSIVLEPDDKGLRAKLNYIQNDMIFLGMDRESPPPEDSDMWDQATPIARI
jgi:hypothetical protein